MRLVKWILITILITIVIWYAFDYIQYSSYDEKKVILDIDGDTLTLGELYVHPDASYMPIVTNITDSTEITGMGLMSFKINDLEDLKKNQKVKVWFSDKDEGNIERIVVSPI